MPEPSAPKALVIVIDAGDAAAQEQARAAFKPSKSISMHALEPGQVKPVRAILFGAEGPKVRPLPHPDSSLRAGKGGRCAVCSSGRREEVDRLLGEGLTPHAIELLLVTGPSDNSIRHHRARCLKPSGAVEPAQ